MSNFDAPSLCAFLDSGAPEASVDYTTLVIVHGVMWHGANFKKLSALAPQHNARVVALNRRDYPGSAQYTSQERALLARLATAPSSGSTADTRAEAWNFMRERARELYEYLVDLVKREVIPSVRGEGKHAVGGIVLVGWSFAGQWMMAFLAHMHSFQSDVDLSRYVRRVVPYDSAIGIGSLPTLANSYHPFHDPGTPPDERVELFHEWATKYFDHGEPITQGTLAMRNALEYPPSSLLNMTGEERGASIFEGPGLIPNGSDSLIARAIAVSGVAGSLKDAALYLPSPNNAEADEVRRDALNRWRGVEVKIVWCKQSIWITVWAAHLISEEIKTALEAGKAIRKVSLVPMIGANHFAHWDLPEETLRIFLEDE